MLSGPICMYRSLWGSNDLKTLFKDLKFNGFTGVEASLSDIDDPALFFGLLKQYDFKWICGLYSSWNDYLGDWQDISVEEHLANMNAQMTLLKSHIVNFGPIAKPSYVNCHSGSDSFTSAEAIIYFNGFVQAQESLFDSLDFGHETHRGRILHSPWKTLEIIQSLPEYLARSLKFTLDISHWIIVCERTIPMTILEPVLQRVAHIHARIGTSQAPQVIDPSLLLEGSPEFAFREYCEAVWARVHEIHPTVTWTPEYGPTQDLYMPNHPPPISLDNLIFKEASRLSTLYQ